MDKVTNSLPPTSSPLSRILFQISSRQPTLHLTTNEFSYLAAMTTWDLVTDEQDSEYHFIQSGFDETTCHSIIRYVDERINEDLATTDVRVNNFLKRALDQGLLSLAGTSVADVGGTYRLTQLAHDLLKPFHQPDESADTETLSQRYLRIDHELSNLNALSDTENITTEEWLEKVQCFLPSLKDLLEGVFRNQELLISRFHAMRSALQNGMDTSLETEIQQLLEAVQTLAEQINDLRMLVMNRADAVLMQLELLQSSVVQKAGSRPLQNALSALFDSLMEVREFANHSLKDLTWFFDTVLDRVRIRIALDPNANLGYLIDRTIRLFDGSSWSLALPSSIRLMQLREWDAPPPPSDNTLFLDDEDEEQIRETPTFQLEILAKDIVSKMLNKNKPVSNVLVVRNVLNNSSLNKTDRHRLMHCTIKELMRQGINYQEQNLPEWVSIDESDLFEIEEQWVISQDRFYE
ncbi:hypothetical protein ABLB90_19950 [Photorhabdus bodei]|uniref:hypothetical protein n=1 Tax=Photorhabdus bodei TaxID=2029681 RepID=UPI0032B76967